VRAGAQALSLLSVPLCVHVLQALEQEPRSLIELRRAVGRPPETTLRGHLKTLTELGLLERKRRDSFPGSVDYGLNRPGRELLTVARVTQAWLNDSPEGEQELGGPAAKSSIKALVEAWSATIIRALAAGPLTLTELSRLISILNYPSIERRLSAMRLAGLIEGVSTQQKGTPYEVTLWLRQAIGPLLAAIRWERRYLGADGAPLGRIDVEAAFLLTVPPITLGEDQTGLCRFSVDLQNGSAEASPTGILASVKEGRVISCVSRLEGDANAWSSGPPSAWLQAVIDGEVGRLEIGGDRPLAVALLDQVHGHLFSDRVRV
jgi:DNA-binding HxlR family transcriptional regulator